MSAIATLERRAPSRAYPKGTEPLVALYDEPWATGPASRGGLTPELARRYDGDLRIPLRADRPTVVANFVETIDGVIAMDDTGLTGGREVSGFSPTDRFVMGLLRATADVVLIGASAVRRSSGGALTPDSVYPAAASDYAELRARLGLDPVPTTMIVTATGDLDPGLPALADPRAPIVIAASEPVAGRLRDRRFGPAVRIEAVPAPDSDVIPAAIGLARRLGARVVVS